MFTSPHDSDNLQEATVSIENGPLILEGALALAKQEDQPGLVLCHPHPLFGGHMDDSRLLAVKLAAITKGFNVLRFNYRGVGKSQGQFGQGIGEIQDTIAAVKFLRNHPHTDSARIGLIGYSFGGSMALAAAIDANPAALVTISAALRINDLDPKLITDSLRYVACPVYIIHGKDDDTVHHIDAEGIYAHLQVKEKYLRIIKGANHFWTRRLDYIISLILAFFSDKLSI